MKTNKALQAYINYILSFFERMNCGIGEGLFLLRSMDADLYRRHMSKDEMDIMHRIVFILCLNDFIEPDTEYHFFRLSKNGFQYIRGAKDIPIKPYLERVVNTTKGKNVFYNELLLMIGGEDAPFCVSDVLLYDIISSFIANNKSYSEFIQERRQSSFSLHMSVWLDELMDVLPQEKWEALLISLSTAIEKEYYYTANTTDINTTNSDNYGVIENRDSNRYKVFISYTHEDENHNNWVQKLASDLKQYFDVIIDVDLPLGKQWTQFMEQAVRGSNKVLLILTPTYKEKADLRIGGGGYESNIITQEIWNQANDAIKFIPIIKKGDYTISYPTYLGSANGLDMTKNEQYEAKLQRLIKELQQN